MSQWIWPFLCLILAIMLITVVYQNLQLKKQIAAQAERMSTQPPYAADRTGKTAPPFEAYLSDGTELAVRTDSLTAPLVLLWFAYDCDPCVQALDQWNRLADQYPGQVWGLPAHGGEDLNDEFSSDRVRFPVLQPGTVDPAELYQINITPQTMVILKDGTIGKVWYGPLSDAAFGALVDILQEPLTKRR